MWFGTGYVPGRKSGIMAAVREIVTLQCSECKRRNYTTTRNKKQMTDKVEKKKFCRFDRKHTVHKEVK